MKVSVEDVQLNNEERAGWNTVDLKDITFIYNGKTIEISEKTLDEWRFTGLNNTDFILGQDWDEYEEKD